MDERKNKIIRFIGDCHGEFYGYEHLIKDADYSIQVGDFGFLDAWERLVKNVDGERHKILMGNHDHYDFVRLNNVPHNLGNFGEYYIEDFKLFFVRGGLSLDAPEKFFQGVWFQEEQLNYLQQERCLEEYLDVKPKIVVTHVPPDSFIYQLHGRNSIQNATGNLLSEMYLHHRPNLWIYGHMHPINTGIKEIGGTHFVGLSILGHADYNLGLTVDENIRIFKTKMENK